MKKASLYLLENTIHETRVITSIVLPNKVFNELHVMTKASGLVDTPYNKDWNGSYFFQDL